MNLNQSIDSISDPKTNKTGISNEIEEIFINTNNKDYVTNNIEHLRSLFSIPLNFHYLRLALTNKRNIPALKIIQKTRIQIIPYLYINLYTYTSLYYLYRMGIIENKVFLEQKRNFIILNNFDSLCNEVEMNFLKLQVEKQRRKINKSVELKKIDRKDDFSFLNMGFSNTEENKFVFVFLLDEVVDYNIDNSFLKDFDGIRSFYENDLFKSAKFKDLKMRIYSSNFKGFSHYNNLDRNKKCKIESILWLISRIKKAGFKYFIASKNTFSKAILAVHLYFNSLDFCRVFSDMENEDLQSFFTGLEKNSRTIVMDSSLLKHYRLIGERLLDYSKLLGP